MTDQFYTKTPNWIFAEMHRMRDAELRIIMAICRKTNGYHKPDDKLSISQLQELTGLSRQGVINGITDGTEHGFIERAGNRKSGYIYGLVVNNIDQSSKPQLVNEVDHTSQRSRPVLVNEVDFTGHYSGPQLVNEVDIQKKERNIKEITKESKRPASPVADASPTPMLPSNLDGWKSFVLDSSNVAGSIGTMIEVLHDVEVNFGRIAGLMRVYGKSNYGYLVANVYIAQAQKIHGDFYDYVTKMKGGNHAKDRQRARRHRARSSEELVKHLQTTADPF